MIKRCGYYVSDGVVCRKDVYINWDKGFTKEDKQEYIKQIITKLGIELQPIADVTTASPNYFARGLSPFYVKTKDGLNIEDTWAGVKARLTSNKITEGLYDYVYLSNLSQKQIRGALNINCFTDVFHNPRKSINTQAKSLAVLRLLYEQKLLDYLNSMESFLNWYKCNGRVHIIEVD